MGTNIMSAFRVLHFHPEGGTANRQNVDSICKPVRPQYVHKVTLHHWTILYQFSLQTFENTVNPILTKPKPKADPPPPLLVNKDNDSTVDNKDGREDNTSKQEQCDEKMDVE